MKAFFRWNSIDITNISDPEINHGVWINYIDFYNDRFLPILKKFTVEMNFITETQLGAATIYFLYCQENLKMVIQKLVYTHKIRNLSFDDFTNKLRNFELDT